MAGRDHNDTRRAVLGAALVVPVQDAVENAVEGAVEGADADMGAAPPDAASWHRALADMARAEAVLDGFCKACREEGLVFADQGELDDRFGDFLGAFYFALRCLMRTPAPDIPALAAKIALAVDHEVGALTGGDLCLAALKADARRLAPPPPG
jgi:hypothetical protein